MQHILFALFTSSSSAQFIEARSNRGTVDISVNVDGAVDNPQFVNLDTGSKHSYLLSHEVMQQVMQRQGVSHAGLGRGLGNLRLTPAEPSLQESANEVVYVDLTHVELSHWRIRRFTMTGGDHHWDQKFAVAVLPDGAQIARWDPNQSGLVGASPDSRFAEKHRNFGITPRRTSSTIEYNLFMEPIRPEWCREERVVYSTLYRDVGWEVEASKVSLGPDYTLAEDIPALFDTGCGSIVLPTESFDAVKAYLISLDIPTLVLPPPEHPLNYPTVNREHISMIPEFNRKIRLIDSACSSENILKTTHILLDLHRVCH
jgi:hypothetical protein